MAITDTKRGRDKVNMIRVFEFFLPAKTSLKLLVILFCTFRGFGTLKGSLAERQRERLDKSYEPTQEAIERTKNENDLRRIGRKRPHDNVGKRENYSFDKEKCLKDVKPLKENDPINFSEVARKYNLKNGKGVSPGNKGQVMKTLLKENGVQVEKLQYFAKKTKIHNSDTSRTRRKLIQYVFFFVIVWLCMFNYLYYFFT